MGAKTSIQWTDSSWNPVRGCREISPGCLNCYAERMASRFSGVGGPFHGFVRDGLWNGVVEVIPGKLGDPLGWRKARRVFVCSMSDLFHEGLSDRDIEDVFGVMALAPRHTFQVLTKRPERMAEWFSREAIPQKMDNAVIRVMDRTGVDTGAHLCFWQGEDGVQGWPLRNVWLGVSAEDQKRSDDRIPILLQTPAAVRFVSL